MKRWLALVPIAVLGSCKFGGPSADPKAYVPSPDGSDDATVDDAHVSQQDDAPSASDDAGGGPGADDAGDASTPDGGDGGPCVAAAYDSGCDPVHNTGCDPIHQCDVGMSLTSMPMGNCLFYTGSEAGGACIMTGLTESCPAGRTCVGSSCRTLCYCNTDCPKSQCCSDTSSVPGFALCAPCM